VGQIEDLQFALLTNSLTKQSDEPSTTDDDEAADPVGAYFQRAKDIAAGVPADFSPSLRKNATRVDYFAGRYGSNAQPISAKRDDNLQKRASVTAEPASTDVDLSKAASRGKIRFEKTIIDGEEWVLGWNDRGENCYSCSVAEHEQMHAEPLEI
jgi:hypothetical protein